jgi:hypothetical protein
MALHKDPRLNQAQAKVVDNREANNPADGSSFLIVAKVNRQFALPARAAIEAGAPSIRSPRTAKAAVALAGVAVGAWAAAPLPETICKAWHPPSEPQAITTSRLPKLGSMPRKPNAETSKIGRTGQTLTSKCAGQTETIARQNVAPVALKKIGSDLPEKLPPIDSVLAN